MIVPTGILSKPLERAQSLIAASSNFRSWVGAADATAALLRIHLVAPEPPEDREYSAQELAEMYPCITLSLGGGYQITRTAVGPALVTGGVVEFRMEAAVLEHLAHSERDAEIDFLNRLGAVIWDLMQTDEGLGHLVPMSISLETVARMSEESRHFEGDIMVATGSIEFAGGGASV